jgi:DnaK suppressor protein
MSKKHLSNDGQTPGQYRQMLLEKRELVLAALGAKTDALVTGERMSEEDQAQQSLQEAVSLRLNGFEYMQLRQIQEALERLQLGDFGICLRCGGLIAAKRLAALPWARYCVECQEVMSESPFDDYTPFGE